MVVDSLAEFLLYEIFTLNDQRLVIDNNILCYGANSHNTVYFMTLTGFYGILLPSSNLHLLYEREGDDFLWSIFIGKDLANCHLVIYNTEGEGRIAIKTLYTLEYLKIVGSCSENSFEERSIFKVVPSSSQPQVTKKFQNTIYHLFNSCRRIDLMDNNKIAIDIILQYLPDHKLTCDNLGLNYFSLEYFKKIYANEKILGMAAYLPSENQFELSPESDWLAKYYGYEGGRKWGAAHTIHHIIRRSIKPSKKICLITSARNEGPYLLEFIAYYKILGIDDIFIYSNDNDDGSDELLSVLAKKNIIKYIANKQESGGAQAKSFGHALSVNLDILNYEWSLIIDVDEFLWLNPTKFNSIIDFIDYHNRLGSQSIFINWIYAGSNGHINFRPELSLKRFEYCTSEPLEVGKNLFKPQIAYSSYCHYPHSLNHFAIHRTHSSGKILNEYPLYCGLNEYANSKITDVSNASIIHFFTKSLEEFIIKCSRNAGGSEKKDQVDFSRMSLNFLGGFICHFKRHYYKIPIDDHYINRCEQMVNDFLSDVDIHTAYSKVLSATYSKIYSLKSLFYEYLMQDNSNQLKEKFFKFITDHAPAYYDDKYRL